MKVEENFRLFLGFRKISTKLGKKMNLICKIGITESLRVTFSEKHGGNLNL